MVDLVLTVFLAAIPLYLAAVWFQWLRLRKEVRASVEMRDAPPPPPLVQRSAVRPPLLGGDDLSGSR